MDLYHNGWMGKVGEIKTLLFRLGAKLLKTAPREKSLHILCGLCCIYSERANAAGACKKSALGGGDGGEEVFARRSADRY